MYVLAAGAELRNFTDLISVVFPNRLNNQGSREAGKCLTQAGVCASV